MAIEDEEEPFGAEVVRGMFRSRLKTARRQYEAGINRLWAGCGGGLIAVVSALRHPSDPFFWLSILSFGLGVLSLGVGAFWTLVSARRVIRHLEDITGILEMRMNYADRPSDREGLGISHPQTLTALTAAGLFIVGLVFAGVLIGRVGDIP
jgi:hypothetical protein